MLPRFVIDLAEPPDRRWAGLVQQYKQHPGLLRLVELARSFDCLTLRLAAPGLLLLLPAAARQEARAWAAELDLPVRCFLALQFLYEWFCLTENEGIGCTCALVAGRGTVVHGRSLDWSFVPQLSELLVELEVVRGPRLVYRAVSVAGYLGLLTGSCPGKFSLSINYRKLFPGVWSDGNPELQWQLRPVLWAGLAAIRGHWPATFLMRDVAERWPCLLPG